MRPRQRPNKIERPAPEQLPAVIESLLFVAEEPQEIGTLARSLNVPRQGIERALEALAESTNGRGLLVQRLGDRVQLTTAPDAAPYIEQFLEVEHGHLSRAALETLAIVAYRQPVTRTMVESVRGVNSDHAVATLLSRRLIEDVGRAPGPGRAVLFGTSIRFLEYFGLQRPDDLPPLPELEQPDEDEAAPAEEQDGDSAARDQDGGTPPEEQERSPALEEQGVPVAVAEPGDGAAEPGDSGGEQES